MKIKTTHLFFVALVLLLTSCSKESQVEKDVAKARIKEYRSVTVINNTSEKLVKECNLTTASGTLVKHKDFNEIENIVFVDFDKDNAFENETEFVITLIDRFDIKYEKSFSANKTGNTDVIVTEEDYVAQSGDWKRKFERVIN